MTAPSRRDVLRALRFALEHDQFRRFGPGEIYALDIEPGVRGWLSLPAFLDSGVVEVSPTVGVRHDAVHAAVDALNGRPTGNAPTVATILGYLMPQRTANLMWRFESDAELEAQAEGLVAAVRAYGLPYMTTNAPLSAVVETLRSSVPWEYSRERIPVALDLLGRRAEAEAFVHSELHKLGGRQDAAASAFRAFAAAFLAADPVE